MFARVIEYLRRLVPIGMVAAVVAGAAWTRDHWWPVIAGILDATTEEAGRGGHDGHDAGTPTAVENVLELSPQGRRNLGVVSGPAVCSTYWRTIVIPGAIRDRPGISDRGVTSPVIGIVTRVHAFPGDMVRPGQSLFTLRLVSEYVQNAQAELYRASHETELEREKRDRLAQVEGVIAGSRLIEIDQQLRRLQTAIVSHRQDLLSRGLSPDQIAEAAAGRFVSSIDVVAPPAAMGFEAGTDIAYEVQELRVELGAQVQAGQLLGILSNHRLLYIVGHAFKREAPLLERAARNHWPVRVEFAEDETAGWPALPEAFTIRHLANTIDAESRTFDFFIPLENQSRLYETAGESFVVWRFRPGHRVRLYVPVEKMTDVIVLPVGAVVRDGPEAYVFRQNGNLFNRLPVHVLHEDRRHVVLANDGSVAPGWYVAHSAAATLNRVLAAQSASGVPVGVHVHADGTVHGAH